ncbi:molybdenum cofactor guanylyltransferase [Geomonas azotofigens]|uniref:molybdenum cofactor guanylyltransferase n=1 Tax=Geomonas azotofigens TaxID=2843196 RepID=UPI001C121771|nr:molybdenum cofactor guanylyltransferase [Geomonas azotofigens]MBU5613865.1 molybdenum cofactor guanylyltransferase [Geomonas azotofigens]
MTLFDDITGVILVGGKSRRMGRDKAFLELGGRTLFERILDAFRANFSRIILAGNEGERFARYRLPFYDDLFPGSALGGLYTGLHYAETDTVFVSSCDLPFPCSRVIGHLCSLTGNSDAVVPRLAHGYEPLHAAYSRSCLAPVREMLQAGEYSVLDLYPRIGVRDVPESELEAAGAGLDAFLNVNTPQDYEAAKRRCL